MILFMKRFIFLPILLLFVLTLLVSCGPYKVEKFVEIRPNETAFLVPLEGASKSGQKQFMSIEYLNDAKVSAKRVSIPQRRVVTGRLPGSYMWIPTMQVIKVDRTPITREWTGSSTTGTSKKNEALWVESKDSIGFGVGVNITAMITEADAAKFLYFYAGVPLAHIVDQNVRGMVNSILSREFAKYDLEDARGMKNEIFAIAAKETTAAFKKMGVTITNLGLAEGLVYRDKEIQTAINNQFEAEMQIQIEQQKNKAQDLVNARNVTIAKANADAKVQEAQGTIAIEKAKATAAKEFAKALDARKAQVDLEVTRMRAEAMLEFARNIKPGTLPNNIMPAGSAMLFGLDTNKK
jgi:regulator of protease activity HflC (stomatin/prohibitin superfamily)